ncbi:MAG: sugar transferase [Ruminococcaceae bacterium]|jgi:lipopolysaccharide/colanic/teichoic acid biosynthesis glycosyltransferase|nr:sugar transferase [Oscillospiraceae bacterium]
MRKINLFLKRFFDLFSAFLGLIILSPFLLLIALIIKLTSKGTVFFCQDRLGLNGKTFKIIKFRTMVMGAEKKGDGLFVYGTDDNRITGIGKLLRKTSLDEIPQLINIIKGDMSIVGPRPPVTYFPYEGYENYPDWAKKRFKMRPGMTGLAQVRTRTTAPWDERIKIDNEYIDRFNIFFDLKIMFKTVLAVLFSKNIYPESKEQIDNTVQAENNERAFEEIKK